jgi:hypothetical protein
LALVWPPSRSKPLSGLSPAIKMQHSSDSSAAIKTERLLTPKLFSAPLEIITKRGLGTRMH